VSDHQTQSEQVESAELEAEEAVEQEQTSLPKKPSDLAVFWAYFRRLGPAGPLAVLSCSLPALGGFVLLGFMPLYGDWLENQGALGMFFYSLVFAVCSGLAILPTYAQAVVGGFVFGKFFGSAAAIAGYVGGAVIGYLVGRRASGNRGMEIIAEKPKWQRVYDTLVRKGKLRALGIITLLRVPPNSPFAITNLVMAGTKIQLPIFIVGTLLGMATRTIAAVWIGDGLDEIDFSDTQRTLKFVVIVIGVIVGLSLLGAIANKAVEKLTKK